MSAKNLGSSGVLYTDRRDFYISPNVVKELWTDVTPFTQILSSKASRQTTDPDFKMFEHRSGWIKQKLTVNAGAPDAWANNGDPATGTVSVNVDGLSGLSSSVDSSMIGLQVEIWSSDETTYKGVALITAVSNPQISLKALGNPRAANFRMTALADDDILYVMGNAAGEGTESPEAFSDELEVVYNSTQIFRTPVEVTGTLYATALRGYSNELARLRMEKLKEHKIQKERAFLFGVRSGGTGMSDFAGDNVTNADGLATHPSDANSKLVRTTMGIIPAIYRYGVASGEFQNIFAISAANYAYSNFVEDTEKIFRNLPSTGRKVALCGAGALTYWNKVDANAGFVKKSGISVNLDNWDRDSLGFNFRRLVSPHGVIDLVYAPALRNAYTNYMVVVDESNVDHVLFRPMKYATNIKTDNAYDGVKDEYFSDEGLGLTLIETHSVWVIGA